MDTLTLSNSNLALTFSRANGALVGLSTHTGWQILNRPALGLSFRLLVPLTTSTDWANRPAQSRRNNPVLGEKQALTNFYLAEDDKRLELTWDGVESEYGGFLPIKVSLTVALTEQQVIFTASIVNNSDYIVENVYCPYLGDIAHPPQAEWFKTFSYNYNTANEWPLWPTYQNLRGYFGIDYPIQFHPSAPAVGTPMAPFILLRSANQGLYCGVCAESSELVAWHTELRPGYGSSIDARLPVTQEIAGQPVATRFAAVHVPYIQAGETRTLTPLVLQAYQGGWQDGVDIYKSWRSTWMKQPTLPDWARQPHAWQQVHINSPEDELRCRFVDLVELGRQCARHGVKAIQLVGWNDGGQDQGNPSHDPDPRLGTFTELKQAIADCQALGVKIVLFSKFTWADRATPRFREQLIKLAIKDPYGDYYLHPGYQYQTATQLLDINTKRLIPMCFLSQDYLELCKQEFQKILDLGADGILFDECLHHGPALLCFDSSHGHRPGAPVYANDNRLIENFLELSRPVRPDFLYAGEGCYDWEMQVYMVSYHRSESKTHIPLSRYLLPAGQFMTAVTGFNDRSLINQCLLYRYIISYEPYNFKGRLDDYPETMAYGRHMDQLRTELRAYFWDGEFRDTVGATVTHQGQVHHPYAVFTCKTTGLSALAIANYDETQPITVQAVLDNGQPLTRYRLVDNATWQPTADGITIPPQSAVVVLP